MYIVGLCIPVVLMVGWGLIKMLPDFFGILYVPCLFQKMLGLYCPGCGGTRAVLSLFKGKVLLSFLYHPLVLYTTVVYVWYMISHTVEKISRGKLQIGMRYRDSYLWIALIILVINIAVKDIALTAFDTDILKLLDTFV
ncbi:MAG: DUF2752 domain-containing protein [Lachnospiraceae bacterium]|nr:DUF2752 domain-containing protein [Lachnospiraceae bacterium]